MTLKSSVPSLNGLKYELSEPMIKAASNFVTFFLLLKALLMFYFLQHLIVMGALIKSCRTPFHKHRSTNLARIFTGQECTGFKGGNRENRKSMLFVDLSCGVLCLC